MKYYNFLAIAFSLIFGAGCADKCEIVDKNGNVIKTFKAPTAMSSASSLDDATSKAAKDLLTCSAMAQVKSAKVSVASFVSNADVSKTSDFGRVFAETLSSKLRSSGVETVELKSQKSVLPSMSEQGEFALSRDIKNFRAALATRYAVVGVYDEIEGGLMVNARLLDLDNGSVLSVSMINISSSELAGKAHQKKPIKLIAQQKESSEATK